MLEVTNPIRKDWLDAQRTHCPDPPRCTSRTIGLSSVTQLALSIQLFRRVVEEKNESHSCVTRNHSSTFPVPHFR